MATVLGESPYAERRTGERRRVSSSTLVRAGGFDGLKVSWGGVWDYPYPEAQQLIRGMRDIFGASKLLWGSDMPNVERFCTYRQCVDYVRKHCSFLSTDEKELILGSNAADLIGLDVRASMASSPT